MLGREAGTWPAAGSATGALGSGSDQASQPNVEGQPLKPTRKPRKSRARWPPVTPEERSAIARANATKDGHYAADRRPTADAIRSIVRSQHYQQRDLEKRGLDWHELYSRPPLEELCPEWRNDWPAMADWVIANHGCKPSRNHVIRRIREDDPWSPENVAGWYLEPPRTRKSVRRAESDPLPLLDCACDHRAQAACARSARPCAWAEASRHDAPWHNPPEPPE